MKESLDAKKCIGDSLKQMQTDGAEFFVDGEEMPLSEVMKRTVQEECPYMADYVVSCTGQIRQVYFDKVNP